MRTAYERVWAALMRDKGDNLERARAAFSGLSLPQLEKQYGQSGKTCREILAEYEEGREEWQVAADWLLSVDPAGETP